MAATPEDLAADLERTRKLAAETSGAQFAEIVAGFGASYEQGQMAAIWELRCNFGISVGEAQMSQNDWFWFNAFPALAGLRMRKMPGFPLDNYCGLADAATDWGNADQRAAKDEINMLYFGK